MSEDPTVEMIKLFPVIETKKTRKRKIAAITYHGKVLESDIAKIPLTKQAELRFEPKREMMITKRLIHVFKQS